MKLSATVIGSLGFILWWAGPLSAAPPAAPPINADGDFFERAIRPILIENCQICHGVKKQNGGLRLDSAGAIAKGGDSGPALVPGKPDESLLIKAVRRSGDIKMPPKNRLNPQAVDALTIWVRNGAVWPHETTSSALADGWKDHRAFQPIAQSPPPAIKGISPAWSAVDRFIQAKLMEKGLKLSPPADRRTLLRRVTFDLIGLPPRIEEIEAFEKDQAPDAFTKVVDRLLASPHYGERWGRHWLDVARYADTKGYVFFEEPDYPWAYTYRDYVIRSLNEDRPFDRFVAEQIAADSMDLKGDRLPLTALGFLTCGGHFMNNPHDIIDDRIDVVCRGILGLTVTCARCHDHKFDPISSSDYYSLYGVFANSVEPAVPPLFAEPAKTPEYEKFAKELKTREDKLAGFLRNKEDELIRGAKNRAGDYLLAAHNLKDVPNTQDFMLIADGSDLNPAMIIRWKSLLDRTRKMPDSIFAPWHALAALGEKDFAREAGALCQKWTASKSGTSRINSFIAKALAEKPPHAFSDVAKQYGEALADMEKRWQELLKKGDKGGPPKRFDDRDSEELRQVFYGPLAPPNLAPGQLNDLDLLPDRPSQDRLKELLKAVETWRATGPGAPPRAMVLEDVKQPTESHVFLRGNPHNLGPVAPRQFLEILSGKDRKPFPHGSGRLDLAKALIDPQNPLTARVIVNRVWMHHFGQGLVRTPSDFGMRSEPASHPELLDYLARQFMDEGWSLKKLHRQLVLTLVYQQQSQDRSECQRVDPENRLYWKMNRRRLDWEATRDAILTVSGNLDRTIGGPSVKDILSPASRRRTLYGHVDRLQLTPTYRVFDFPSADASSPIRDQTTIPQQALFFLNSPFVIENAKTLLKREELSARKSPFEKLEALFKIIYGRTPGREEIQAIGGFIGDNPSTDTWAKVVQGLLETNGFVYLD